MRDTSEKAPKIQVVVRLSVIVDIPVSTTAVSIGREIPAVGLGWYPGRGTGDVDS
jgi:hypothetical protein